MTETTRFAITLEGTIRLTREEDLPDLEWFGMFTAYREPMEQALARQEAGEVLMLVAEVNRFPAGQLWVDLRRAGSAPAAYIWAVRVLPALQGVGIGTRLLAEAERLLRERGVEAVELGVEARNPGARRLYERLGYRAVREEHDSYQYTPPDGEPVRVPVERTILRKELLPGAPSLPL